ncbi:hypothetical protein GPECTOR_78g67 [Gonium pectorale]|uniref:F-box domain-containing protein n=1 Tax=Gonium pectorale TaxID=33097 RepID=A0A150G1X9_GONPE|nr:hypothetical protein GPECTOR_78g67 [Gonium pectorale]|eukprot:KXZ43879.1 hypothetical protein GPECTOR_78g67 [Gonium pectorale]
MQFLALPESFLLQLIGRIAQDDVKSLRATCSRLCGLVASAPSARRLTCLRAAPLLSAPSPPSLSRLPPASFLDFNARNADCGHRLLSALRARGGALERSLRSVRLSGRDGLLSALQALRLACPQLERLEIRCQHSYRGRHRECADLGRCLAELEDGFPGLQELHLTRFPISSAQLVHLCDSLPDLRALSVRGLAAALNSDSLSHLHRLSNLVSLSVDHLWLQGRSFPCGPQLRSLELSDATISADSFATLNSLTCLTSLSLWGTGARSALGFAPLGGLTALRRLHLELVLDREVLAGLAGCGALTSLSAQGARVTAPETAGGAGCDAADAAAAPAALPPQLSGVTRLSLEGLDGECLPLAAWLPALRSLVLDDGEGVWRAVAGHGCLTSLRVASGGSLPAAPGAGEAAWRPEAAGGVEAEKVAAALVPAAGGCVAAAAAARAASALATVPVPPCSACAAVAKSAPLPLPRTSYSGTRDSLNVVAAPPPAAGPTGAACRAQFPRSSSAAALAAAAALEKGCITAAGGEAWAGAAAALAPRLQRLELTRMPLITARGVAAAAAGLANLTELRVSSCQSVCREACIWLPQQLGRPGLSVVCSHASVYDEH